MSQHRFSIVRWLLNGIELWAYQQQNRQMIFDFRFFSFFQLWTVCQYILIFQYMVLSWISVSILISYAYGVVCVFCCSNVCVFAVLVNPSDGSNTSHRILDWYFVVKFANFHFLNFALSMNIVVTYCITKYHKQWNHKLKRH